MAQADQIGEPLTPYERAVCYYALPKVITPVTLGLIVAYAVCLLEAVGAIVFGIVRENQLVLSIGIYALGGLVVFGLIAFFLRALGSDIRKRRILKDARVVPAKHFEDVAIPDPFSTHLLLRRPIHSTAEVYVCSEEDAEVQYLVDQQAGLSSWRINSPEGTEVCQVKILRGPGSFLFSQDLPRILVIEKQDKEVARIVRRFSFDSAIATIEPADASAPRYVLKRSGIYKGDRLVGRVYHLRGNHYLDVEKVAFNEAILAYFVTVT